MAYCSNCGKVLTSSAKFCAHCGAPTSVGSDRQITVNTSTRSAHQQESRWSTPAIDHNIRACVSQTLFVVAQSMLPEFQRLLIKHRLVPLGLASGADTSAIRQRARAEVIGNKNRLRYVCILGGWNLVPPFELEHALDGESSFSDAPYAGAAESETNDPMELIPEVSVSRVPVSDMAVIERVLFQPLVSRTASEAFAFSVTAEKWINATQAILRNSVLKGGEISDSRDSSEVPNGEPVIFLSPGWNESTLNEWVSCNPLVKGSLLHFNVHGGADTPEWVGESEDGQYQEIFSPGTVADFSSAVLFTEACFGGAMGYDDQSVVEHFFMHGGHAFVGCSVPAYGDPGVKIYDVSTFGADTLALAFFSRLQSGMRLGEAFSAAKMAVLTDDPPLCHPYSVKTVCSFNLYGAPWHAMKRETQTPRPSSQIANPESALARVRARIANSNSEEMQDDDESLLQKLRVNYRGRLKVPTSQRTLLGADVSARLDAWLRNDEITQTLTQANVSSDNLRLHLVEFTDQVGYLIEGHANSSQNQKWILVLNDQGLLQQVITTKTRG